MVVIRELFVENRFPSGWKLIPLFIYMPVGVLLATIRLFIGVQAILAASLLHKLSSFRSIILRIMCAILGIFVIEENADDRDESVKVVVTNHVSIFDHLAIHLLTGSISVNVGDLPSFFHFALSVKDLGNIREKENLIQNVRSCISNDVVLDIQPEGAITSGKKGLLRFSPWPCSLGQKIQPVSIRLWRPPLMDVSPSVVSASWSSDFFWFLLVPFTVFTVKYLPVVQQSDNESSEDVSKKLEKNIADDLKIVTTNFTVADKAEYEKRLMAETAIEILRPRPVPYNDTALMEMASRVKEVLPNVPMKVICTELAKTRSVDLTISNFLEELVRYTPEPQPSPERTPSAGPERKKSSLEAGQPSTSFDTSAKTFPKSAQDRMLSFQERKSRLIESARQRYMEKHALNIMNSS